jgi:hypothetical protein
VVAGKKQGTDEGQFDKQNREGYDTRRIFPNPLRRQSKKPARKGNDEQE